MLLIFSIKSDNKANQMHDFWFSFSACSISVFASCLMLLIIVVVNVSDVLLM